jgi:hypothetical protein
MIILINFISPLKVVEDINQGRVGRWPPSFLIKQGLSWSY